MDLYVTGPKVGGPSLEDLIAMATATRACLKFVVFSDGLTWRPPHVSLFGPGSVDSTHLAEFIQMVGGLMTTSLVNARDAVKGCRALPLLLLLALLAAPSASFASIIYT